MYGVVRVRVVAYNLCGWTAVFQRAGVDEGSTSWCIGEWTWISRAAVFGRVLAVGMHAAAKNGAMQPGCVSWLSGLCLLLGCQVLFASFSSLDCHLPVLLNTASLLNLHNRYLLGTGH